MKTVRCRGVHGADEEVSVEELSFRPSVYGVIIKDGHVLLSCQHDGYDFPGGGMDLGESFEQTLEREVKEETGLKVKKDKLLHVQNDFFTHPGNKKHFQSILLYFSCKDIEGDVSIQGIEEQEKGFVQGARWIPLADIHSIKFYNPVDSIAIITRATEGAGI